MRSPLKKLFIRVLIYLVILISLPYGYFWLQAKTAIDAFLLNQPLDGELSYSRLSLDLSGNVYLKEASFTLEGDLEVFTVEKIKIELSSIFDLLSAKEHILYQEYPARISLQFEGGQSKQPLAFFKLFKVDVAPQYSHWVYPTVCQQSIKLSPKVFSFEFNVDFEIHATSDISKVNFSFDSLELFNLLGQFKINNFSDASSDGNFLSDLTLSFKDIAILQKNTQRCLTANQLNRDSFYLLIEQQFTQLEIDEGLIINQSALSVWKKFIYIPDQLDLVFDLPPGKKYSQVDLLPIQTFQPNIGLNINLNKNSPGTLFKPFLSSLKQQPKKEPALEAMRQTTIETHKLRPNKKVLSHYLGAKVLLKLKNGKSVIGYIEVAAWKSLTISQRKYKGKTQLPFNYSKIKSIELLRLN